MSTAYGALIAPPPGHRLAWLDEVTRTTLRTTFTATGEAVAVRDRQDVRTYVMGCDCGVTFQRATVVATTELIVEHFERERERIVLAQQRGARSQAEWEGRYGR